MSYRIETIELFVRETLPGRIAFKLGAAAKAERRTNPLVHVRMIVRDGSGRRMWGTSGDRLSVRWLDKRPGRDRGLKLRELVDLIEFARVVYLERPDFITPFQMWQRCHPPIVTSGRQRGQEDLSSSFASALFERALVDAVSRLLGKPTYQLVRENQLGIDAGQIHPELERFNFRDLVPDRPRTKFFVRHTVGTSDVLSPDKLGADRIGDGLPETLVDNIERYGIRFFKVKISGNVEADIRRLTDVWHVLPKDPETTVTLDANEAYADLAAFERLVKQLRSRVPGLFDHLAYIEQPLRRTLTLDPATGPFIRRINALKPLLIDEADSTVDAYRRAYAIGYAGTSHKNCKGFFKSLLNSALVAHYEAQGQFAFMSGEDLQNLPIVPLHQDFVTVSLLGLNNCERNGHHLNYGLSMLSPRDKASITQHHSDLYEQLDDEWFLKIRGGMVETGSLHVPGFGVADEPDFASMEPLRPWVHRRFPA